MNIVTNHIFPPIPDRSCDWSAIDADTYDGAEDSTMTVLSAREKRPIAGGRAMTDAPLIITPEVRAALHQLRDAAARKPVDMRELMHRLETPSGKFQYTLQMGAQTILIPGPWDFLVTFSLETGHPAGTARHMSISVNREGRVPHPRAVWMVAEALGFVGGLETCRLYTENLQGHGVAINVIQPLSVQQAAHG
jgi:hypothetical protein